jgi:hypothetical protein
MRYTIPVTWEMVGNVEVEAESLTEAIEKAYDADIPIPIDSEYVDSSFRVMEDYARAQNHKEV